MNVIETKKLCKYFGDFCANRDLSLEIPEGSIVAICGENGAGKTTLMNMLYGMFPPTTGDIYIKGKKVSFQSPTDAIKAGIGMVHQHFKLVPSLTVYENILLGSEIKHSVGSVKLPWIDQVKEEKIVDDLIKKYGFELNPSARVSDLSLGEMQRIEILKMLYRDVDILILDEPTAVLTPQEADALMASMKALKGQGKTLIIITHKLQEVMSVADRILVIRRGELVGLVDASETNLQDLASMMVGRKVELSVTNDRCVPRGGKIYEVSDLSLKNQYGKEVLKNINFSICTGEIVGIAGVEGNGQSELMKALSGLLKVDSGTIRMAGKDLTNAWPRDIRKARIAIIPEDRYAHGLCRDMSLRDNSICGYQYEEDISRHRLLNLKNCENKCDQLIRDYDVRISDRDGNAGQLSGGNAQKLIVARELDRNPKVILASQPTRGVDIGSIEFIHSRLLEKKCEGVGILLISSELNEILSLADRILVMYKGEIVGELPGRDATRDKVGLMMAGVRPEEAN